MGATKAVGKVPFCFSVSRTHLYDNAEDVPVYGAILATVVTAPDGGACAEAVQGTPVTTPVYDIPVNVSWQNSSSKYLLVLL
jgi:hypothetical protein